MRVKHVLLVVTGIYVCLVATIAHRHIAELGGIGWPWGIALGLVAAYAAARTADGWARVGAAYFGLGWALGLTMPMVVPGNSYLIASDGLGLLFMFGGFGALALAVVRGSREHRLSS